MGIEQDWEEASPDLQHAWDQANPAKPTPQAQQSFWDQHPDLRTTLRYGLPLAAGVATIPFTGGMSVPAIAGLEMVAGAGGEAANQALGVNEPSAQNLGWATASGGLGRPVGAVIGYLAKAFPGVSTAMKAAVTDKLRELPDQLIGAGSAREAYKALSKQDLSQRIKAFPELSNKVDELNKEIDLAPWEELRKAAKTEGMGNLFEQIAQSLKGAPGKITTASSTISGKAQSLPTGLPKTITQGASSPPGLSFEEADATQKLLRKLADGTTDPVKRGQFQQLRSSMLNDIENAPMPTTGPVEAWKTARKAARLEHAQLKLAEQTEKSIGVKDGVDIVQPDQIVKWLKSPAGIKEVKSRLDNPDDYRKILNEYRLWAAKVGHEGGSAYSGMIGTIAGSVMGGLPGGVGGFSAGYLVGQEISKAMMTSVGRKMASNFIKDPSKSNWRRVMMATGTEAGVALRNNDSQKEEE